MRAREILNEVSRNFNIKHLYLGDRPELVVWAEADSQSKSELNGWLEHYGISADRPTIGVTAI